MKKINLIVKRKKHLIFDRWDDNIIKTIAEEGKYFKQSVIKSK